MPFARPFGKAEVGLLPHLRTPGMITEDDEALYFDIARGSAASDRIFIEVGTWLGRSTTRICQGLSQEGGDWRLFCYDRFVWHPTHAPKARVDGVLIPEVEALKGGDSFLPTFLTLLGPFAGHVEVRMGELEEIKDRLGPVLPRGRPVGVLFVDASKGWNNTALLRWLANRLIDGDRPSILVFQDFFMWSAYPLIFMLMLLPELVPFAFARNGGCCAFVVASKLDREHPILRNRSFDQVTAEQILGAWERLRSFIPDEKIDMEVLQIALPLMLWSRGFHDMSQKAGAALRLSNRQRRRVADRILSNEHLAIPPLVQLLAK